MPVAIENANRICGFPVASSATSNGAALVFNGTAWIGVTNLAGTGAGVFPIGMSNVSGLSAVLTSQSNSIAALQSAMTAKANVSALPVFPLSQSNVAGLPTSLASIPQFPIGMSNVAGLSDALANVIRSGDGWWIGDPVNNWVTPPGAVQDLYARITSLASSTLHANGINGVLACGTQLAQVANGLVTQIGPAAPVNVVAVEYVTGTSYRFTFDGQIFLVSTGEESSFQIGDGSNWYGPDGTGTPTAQLESPNAIIFDAQHYELPPASALVQWRINAPSSNIANLAFDPQNPPAGTISNVPAPANIASVSLGSGTPEAAFVPPMDSLADMVNRILCQPNYGPTTTFSAVDGILVAASDFPVSGSTFNTLQFDAATGLSADGTFALDLNSTSVGVSSASNGVSNGDSAGGNLWFACWQLLWNFDSDISGNLADLSPMTLDGNPPAGVYRMASNAILCDYGYSATTPTVAACDTQPPGIDVPLANLPFSQTFGA